VGGGPIGRAARLIQMTVATQATRQRRSCDRRGLLPGPQRGGCARGEGISRHGARGQNPALGGRAYSFADADTGDFVDNGQHVLMGCYRETIDFLDRIGARDQLVFHEDLEIEMLAGPGRSAVLKTARLPGPMHMTSALLGYRHLSVGERISVMRGGLGMLAMRRRNDGELRRLTVRS